MAGSARVYKHVTDGHTGIVRQWLLLFLMVTAILLLAYSIVMTSLDGV
jgi:hypothetical protein